MAPIQPVNVGDRGSHRGPRWLSNNGGRRSAARCHRAAPMLGSVGGLLAFNELLHVHVVVLDGHCDRSGSSGGLSNGGVGGGGGNGGSYNWRGVADDGWGVAVGLDPPHPVVLLVEDHVVIAHRVRAED